METAHSVEMEELRRRHMELRLVLDNVGQGLLTLRRDGAIAGDHSAVLTEWLGPYRQGTPFWEYLGAADAAAGRLFRAGWQQILFNDLPLELLLDQLPKRAQAEGRVLGLAYRPILTGDELTKLLVIVSDITVQMERERWAAEQREMVAIFEKIVQNRTAFLEFFDEANEQVRVVTAEEERPPLPELRRQLHTLKGTSGLFGLVTVQELCHDLETRMAERQGDLEREERQRLLARWRRLAHTLASLFGKGDANRIEIDNAEYMAVVQAIANGLPREQIMRMVVAWRLQPVQPKLDHLANYACDLAQRLGKGTPRLIVEANRLRVSPDRWGAFFAGLTHVVRNAVDHGLEGPEERRGAGKPEEPTMALRAALHGQHFVIEISDDGRGIQWERVAERARGAGLPAETRGQLIEALFSDGVSTKEDVDEYSGRGVGMSAVREACVELGGQIKLASQPGRGTTFQFLFPHTPGGGAVEAGARVEPARASVAPRTAPG